MEQSTVVNPSIQPPLFGLDVEARGAAAPARRLVLESGAARHERPAATPSERHPRHRYWSVRDLSRRIWLGRGYELLRGLIRADVLPATRSSRNWWIADADVRGLLAAFEPQAGKVRAFRRLDVWLRERCWVTPWTTEAGNALRRTESGFAWRGHVYLPKATWTAESAPDGKRAFRYRDGTSIGDGTDVAAADRGSIAA